MSTEHPEDTCGRCGGPNIAWAAPSPLWNEVMRGGDINGPWQWNEIICPTCFAVLAEKVGVAQQWRLTAEQVHVPLQTVTPSGRTWNEQTWLWDDAPTEPRQATEAEVRAAWAGGPFAPGVLYPQMLDAPDLPSDTLLAVSFDRDGQVLDAVKLTGIDPTAQVRP